ncbi:MAG: Wzz/FepE/Etk N-terminal domain-containing protein [Eubacteriales bacterium]|nr:Wzz/FepE/Etk N-terminal domain-containing protein [Eubacteriales bacterium]
MGLATRKKGDGSGELAPEKETLTVVPSLDQNMDEEMEIDLLDIVYLLLDKMHYIIMCLLIGAVLFNAFSFFFIAPTYESTARMYVVSASNDSVVDLTDLNIGTSLTSDYEELMFSYPVLDRVIHELNLDMETDELKAMITLENPQDTRILNVKATSTDPEEAKNIANKMVEVSVEYLPETMSTNPPNIAQTARLADSKAGPSYLRYTLIGAILGAFLYCAYLIVRHLMDDTIHTSEDMEKYFGVVPLTSIPNSEAFVELERKEDEDDIRRAKKRKAFRKGKKK